VDLPQAHVSHRSPTRIRLKITSRRGDAPYFADLQQAFDSARLTESVAVNTLTGSVLFVGEAVDLDSISDFAQDRQLFKLRQSRPLSRPVARYVAEPLHQADGIIEGLTGGYLNLGWGLTTWSGEAFGYHPGIPPSGTPWDYSRSLPSKRR
jgi:hypothetical protein